MKLVIVFILFLAMICFALSTFNITPEAKTRLIAGGLLLYFLAAAIYFLADGSIGGIR